jgi:integrase
MSQRKIKNAWWVDFRFRRKRYRRKSPDNSKAGARAYESLLVSKLNKGESIDDNEAKESVPKFSEYAQRWLKTYVKNNNKPSEIYKKGRIVEIHLNPFFGKIPIDKITQYKIEEYKSAKLEKQQAKTTNNQLGVLSKCLHCAYDEFEIEKKFPNIMRYTKTGKEADYLTYEECEQLVGSADGVWKEMILVALQTGLRLGELLALDWNDIKFFVDNDSILKGIISVRRSMYRGSPGPTKNNGVRAVSLTEDLVRLLAGKKDRKGFVFTDNEGRSLNHDRALRNLHRICKVAGIRDTTWHPLRHTFASQLAMAGVSMRIISDLLGHSSEQMTRIYAHLSPHTFETAINNLKLPTFDEIFGHQVGTEEELLVETKKRKQEYQSNFRNFVR